MSVLLCNKPTMLTHPLIISSMGDEYQSKKCSDALGLSDGRYSSHLLV